jgi:large subunit ribosomal protein L19
MADIVRTIALKGVAKNKNIQDFKSGDTVGVYVRVREGEKERVQLYKGVVLKIQGSGAGRSFTVRKISNGVGVERSFPFTSPSIDKVEIISHGKVRRSRLYFLRALKGKAATISSELAVQAPKETVAAAAAAADADSAKE